MAGTNCPPVFYRLMHITADIKAEHLPRCASANTGRIITASPHVKPLPITLMIHYGIQAGFYIV